MAAEDGHRAPGTGPGADLPAGGSLASTTKLSLSQKLGNSLSRLRRGKGSTVGSSRADQLRKDIDFTGGALQQGWRSSVLRSHHAGLRALLRCNVAVDQRYIVAYLCCRVVSAGLPARAVVGGPAGGSLCTTHSTCLACAAPSQSTPGQ